MKRRLLTTAVLIATLAIGTAEAQAGDKYQDEIETISAEYGISKELVESIIQTESCFNKNAVSSCGAIGLMQIRPEFQQERMERLGVTDLTDPYSNILVGVDYIMELATKYQDVYVVLVAYNSGEYSEDFRNALNGSPNSYADKVLNYSMELELERYGG